MPHPNVAPFCDVRMGTLRLFTSSSTTLPETSQTSTSSSRWPETTSSLCIFETPPPEELTLHRKQVVIPNGRPYTGEEPAVPWPLITVHFPSPAKALLNRTWAVAPNGSAYSNSRATLNADSLPRINSLAARLLNSRTEDSSQMAGSVPAAFDQLQNVLMRRRFQFEFQGRLPIPVVRWTPGQLVPVLLRGRMMVVANYARDFPCSVFVLP